MYGMDSKLRLGDQLKKSEQSKKKIGIYNFNSVIIFRVLRILVS